MQAIGKWTRGFETVLTDERTHRVTVDLPVDEGGRSAGPSSLELAILALAGGLTTTFVQIARRRRLAVQGLAIALEGERTDSPCGIARVRGTLRVRTRGPSEEVEGILHLALRESPVAAIFARAGIEVEVTPLLQPPTL